MHCAHGVQFWSLGAAAVVAVNGRRFFHTHGIDQVGVLWGGGWHRLPFRNHSCFTPFAVLSRDGHDALHVPHVAVVRIVSESTRAFGCFLISFASNMRIAQNVRTFSFLRAMFATMATTVVKVELQGLFVQRKLVIRLEFGPLALV